MLPYRTVFLAAVALLAACHPSPEAVTVDVTRACAAALVPPEGTDLQAQRVSRAQELVARGHDTDAHMEQVGWAWAALARARLDESLWDRAGDAARCLAPTAPSAARLLGGHVALNQHRFEDAEQAALALIAERQRWFDWALLGDVRLERGDVQAAATAYQHMADLRPGPEAYVRVARLRWVTGDTVGAARFAEMAVDAAAPEPTSRAWLLLELAGYVHELGDDARADRLAQRALQLRPDYPPGLERRALVALGRGDAAAALPLIARAQAVEPAVDHAWILADTQRAAGEPEAAIVTEAWIAEHGQALDPRTYSLYLASRGLDASLALTLADAELDQRSDVHSWDALAWALLAAGRNDDAWQAAGRALNEGTQDPRLFLHAALIAREVGAEDRAVALAAEALRLATGLLPSERARLDAAFPGQSAHLPLSQIRPPGGVPSLTGDDTHAR